MKWVPVESFDYSIPNQVKLTYRDILEFNKIRCVNNTSSQTEFSSQSHFRDGKSTVTENWVTKGPVESGEWHWEVELKPGEY